MAGKRMRTSIVRNGREIASDVRPVSQKNVEYVVATVDPKVLNLHTAEVPEGRYKCRFAVVGETTAWAVSFTVFPP